MNFHNNNDHLIRFRANNENIDNGVDLSSAKNVSDASIESSSVSFMNHASKRVESGKSSATSDASTHALSGSKSSTMRRDRQQCKAHGTSKRKRHLDVQKGSRRKHIPKSENLPGDGSQKSFQIPKMVKCSRRLSVTHHQKVSRAKVFSLNLRDEQASADSGLGQQDQQPAKDDACCEFSENGSIESTCDEIAHQRKYAHKLKSKTAKLDANLKTSYECANTQSGLQPQIPPRKKIKTLVKKTRKSKQPKDSLSGASSKPKRPMSAYNFFFRDERIKILAERSRKGSRKDDEKCNSFDSVNNCSSNENSKSKIGSRPAPHGKVSFEDLGKLIATRWKNVDRATLEHYEARAKLDGQRYRREIDEYYDRESEKRRAFFFPGLSATGVDHLNVDLASSNSIGSALAQDIQSSRENKLLDINHQEEARLKSKIVDSRVNESLNQQTEDAKRPSQVASIEENVPKCESSRVKNEIAVSRHEFPFEKGTSELSRGLKNNSLTTTKISHEARAASDQNHLGNLWASSEMMLSGKTTIQSMPRQNQSSCCNPSLNNNEILSRADRLESNQQMFSMGDTRNKTESTQVTDQDQDFIGFAASGRLHSVVQQPQQQSQQLNQLLLQSIQQQFLSVPNQLSQSQLFSLIQQLITQQNSQLYSPQTQTHLHDRKENENKQLRSIIDLIQNQSTYSSNPIKYNGTQNGQEQELANDGHVENVKHQLNM